MKQMMVIVLGLLIAPLSYACKMDRALSETHFVLDPEYSRVYMQTKKDYSQFEVGGCSEATTHVLLSPGLVYYQDDTGRRETASGTLAGSANNCSMKTDFDFKSVPSEQLNTNLKSRRAFLDQCVGIIVQDISGHPLRLHKDSVCSITKIDSVNNIYKLSGERCVIAVTPITRLKFSTQVDANCANYSIPQDVEMITNLFPAKKSEDDATQLELGQAFGSRYARFTVLPKRGSVPQIDAGSQEYIDQRSFVRVLSADVDPGKIDLRTISSGRSVITPTFLVNNNASPYCDQTQSFCLSPSAYTTPVSAQFKLTYFDLSKKTSELLADWSHSIKVPPFFSGLADAKPENNLGKLPGGAMILEHTLKPGQHFELVAEFFEPRENMDENSRQFKSYRFDASILDPQVIHSGMESIPTLPTIGLKDNLDKLPILPSVSLGQKGFEDFIDRFNMNRNWTHFYDRVCNPVSRKCALTGGTRSPFIRLKIYFRMNQKNQPEPIRAVKESEVFGSYDKRFAQFAQKVCQ